MLPVTLDYLRPVFCEHNIASVSGLSAPSPVSSVYLNQRHWQYWVHKTQDEDNPETLATLGSQSTGRR
jgi:hypothetical protein